LALECPKLPKTLQFTPKCPATTKHLLGDKLVYQFRDDLHTLPGPYLTGNKSRKFKYLLKHLPERVDTIVSHGGVQSNAMVALAALGMATNTSVVYYCKKPGRWLTSNPSGNYHRALSLGIQLKYLKNEEYSDCFPTTPLMEPIIDPPAEGGRTLWVPQGGAMKEAQEGCYGLADDIFNSVQEGVPTAVVIPAGTGTTSLFVHRRMSALCEAGGKDIQIFPVACVAGREDLERQMRALSGATWKGKEGEEEEQLPKILDPFIPFGSVDKRILSAWRLAKEAGMYLDLVYGAVAVHTVLQCWKKSDILNGRQVMFVNTGGLEGVASMMNRYKHAGLVEDGEFD